MCAKRGDRAVPDMFHGTQAEASRGSRGGGARGLGVVKGRTAGDKAGKGGGGQGVGGLATKIMMVSDLGEAMMKHSSWKGQEGEPCPKNTNWA